jgi:hypothetical protein
MFAVMAKVHLLCTTGEDHRDSSFQRGVYTRLRQSFDLAKSRHTLVAEPREAEIILFAELHFLLGFHVMRHPVYRSFRNKSFAFGIDDYVAPFLPGVFASIDRKHYSPRRVRSGFFLSIQENPFLDYDTAPEREYLFSFVGSVKTWPVRAELKKLAHPRSHFVDTSTESLPVMTSGTDEERALFWRRYADIARRSKFVLCPRGAGASSIRLFEMMKMGRVPVILSDAWVPPLGPKWDEFIIRVPEGQAAQVPAILEEREAEFLVMGEKARQAWVRWFSPETIFDTIVDWCLEIKAARRAPEWLARAMVYPQLLQPQYGKMYLRNFQNDWRNRLCAREALPA